MTNRLYTWLAIAAMVAAVAILALAFASPGRCMFCSPVPCSTSSGCSGQGCVCVVPPGEYWGECWGIE